MTFDTVITIPLANRLQAYVNSGGKLLIEPGIGSHPLADVMGADFKGPAPFAPDYLMLAEEIADGIEPMPHSCELPGVKLLAHSGVDVLSYSGQPYFNRTWQHFCSHQYTPLDSQSDDPVIIQSGDVITIARPLFTEYAQSAKRVHKQVIGNCLARLLPQPRVGTHNLPSTAIVTVRQLGDDLIVHLLHYVHQRRGKTLDIIEDVIPLHNVEISVRADVGPTDVELVPEQESLSFAYDTGYVCFTVPVVNGYQIVRLAGAARS